MILKIFNSSSPLLHYFLLFLHTKTKITRIRGKSINETYFCIHQTKIFSKFWEFWKCYFIQWLSPSDASFKLLQSWKEMIFLYPDDILWWHFNNAWWQWGKQVQLTSHAVKLHKRFKVFCTCSHCRNDRPSFWDSF